MTINKEQQSTHSLVITGVKNDNVFLAGADVPEIMFQAIREGLHLVQWRSFHPTDAENVKGAS